MKTKLIGLMLTLTMVITLIGVAAPASAAVDTRTVEPTLAPAAPTDWDTAYVSLNGNDTTGSGSRTNPWRTITWAVQQLAYTDAKTVDEQDGQNDPDRILVYQTGLLECYGIASPTNPVAEHIVVNKSVLIQAYGTTDPDDPLKHRINITGQGDPQVIEITASDVTIDGLFITGADIGIYAHGTDPMGQIENVQILNCVIKVDQVSNTVGTGIEMDYVKYPVIDNNIIGVGVELDEDILSVEDAWGILMYDCFQSTVTNNDIYIHGDPLAIGIEMEQCEKSLVQDNYIDVLCGGDNLGIGLMAKYCDLIQILDNTVYVEVNGVTVALGFGIKVWFCNRSEVLRNSVEVQNNGVQDPFGFMVAMGIWVMASNESKVNENTMVDVQGCGRFDANNLPPQTVDAISLLSEEDLEDLAELEGLMDISIGCIPTWAMGAAVVIGIKVSTSCLVQVNDNADVDVRLAVDFNAGDDIGAGALGAGLALGIFGCGAEKLMVAGNTVSVDKADPEVEPRPDVMVYVKVHSIDPLIEQISVAGAVAVAIGTGLLGCDLAMVVDNSIQAYATMYADIQAVPTPDDILPMSADSALARFDSQFMTAVYQSAVDTIGSEDISAEISGDMPTIESFAGAGGIVAGIGALVAMCDGVVIANNSPVIGSGDIEGRTWSKETDDTSEAEAMMGGLGLGGGIVAIDSKSAEIVGNTGVAGTGTADIAVGAQHDPPVMIAEAEALGAGAGIGLGIFVFGIPDYCSEAGELTGADLEALEVAPEHIWYGRTVVMGNQVSATGLADKVCVHAEDQLPDHPAFAIGMGLGGAVGIGAIWSPCILIKQNQVGAIGDATVCVVSEAIDSFDPLSMGGAAGIGVGIASVYCWLSQIVDNEPYGEGTAVGFVMAIETPLSMSPAVGLGGSLGLGTGILVFGSGGSLVTSNGLDDEDTQDTQNISNAVTTGLGDAKTLVFAINTVPLDSAVALALAAGIGKGIAVVYSPCTDVVESNTAAGEGTAKVCSWTYADFDYAFKLGVSVSVDILQMLWPGTLEVGETDYDAMHGPHFGGVNYNSMVDPVESIGENGCTIIIVDAGLLKIGWPKLNAQFNWWNDPTGPTGLGPGTGDGEAVYWCGKSVYYEPWLYVIHTDVLYEQIGKFGFSIKLCKGLNAISTPIALEQVIDFDEVTAGVQSSRKWEDIEANSSLEGKWKFMYKFNSATQQWEPVAPTDTFDPLEAWYIYLFEDCNSLILMVNSDDGHPYCMPQRTLDDKWSLIGPNPIFPMPGMPVDDALSSVAQTPAGAPGYTQVISPVVRCQDAWYYVPGMKMAPFMKGGDGFWIWMMNEGVILVGFGFSPLPDKLSRVLWWYH